MLDRIDLVLEVPAVSAAELLGRGVGERSAAVQARVVAARAAAAQRRGAARNAALTAADLDRLDPIEPSVRDLLVRAMERFALSARGVVRLRRVARTIADVAGERRVAVSHLAEALQFRLPASAVPGSPARSRERGGR
jgi:magnesium chelatase family protein